MLNTLIFKGKFYAIPLPCQESCLQYCLNVNGGMMFVDVGGMLLVLRHSLVMYSAIAELAVDCIRILLIAYAVLYMSYPDTV